MDRGIITLSTYMLPCAPAQQRTGASLVFSQTDEAFSRMFSNTNHMHICFFSSFFLSSLRPEPSRTHVCANIMCLLTSADLQERD